MITSVDLIRFVTQFDSYAAVAGTGLRRLSLFFAENGKGKTSLSAILRSLSSGNPLPIQERSRLGTRRTPHVVIQADVAPNTFVFENNAWNHTYPLISVFDDTFVVENVYSGLEVTANHRQNLHGIILGSEGVNLAQRVDALTSYVTDLNTRIRDAANAIPTAVRGDLTVDQFCQLPVRQNIEQEVADLQHRIDAVAHAPEITGAGFFANLSIPTIDFPGIQRLLSTSIENMEQRVLDSVTQHLAHIGDRAERWVADGVRRIFTRADSPRISYCPFCAQDLSHSEIVVHYSSYFSQEYSNLKRSTNEALTNVATALGGDALATFLRQAQDIQDKARFWSGFAHIEPSNLDAGAIQASWQETRQCLSQALERKQSAPLEVIQLRQAEIEAFDRFIQMANAVAVSSDGYQAANAHIRAVKDDIARANLPALTSQMILLNLTRERFRAESAAHCDAYVALKLEKERAEADKAEARRRLDEYRTLAFPHFQESINRYLRRFNADFQIVEVQPSNAAGRPSSTYQIRINNALVNLSANPGLPSFRNTLSAGDRNSLGLAFFLASLEQEPNLNERIVVLDDVVTSLDDHRRLVSSEEVRSLLVRVSQLVVLSHNKHFLCDIWNSTQGPDVATMQITRAAVGSTIGPWDPSIDSLTMHDRSYELLVDYRVNNAGDQREVAQAVRLVLEGYLRAKFPDSFPPGLLLGAFINLTDQRVGQPNQLLDRTKLTDLSAIVAYANLFHHNTNANWRTQAINDGELLGFVRRTLELVRG